MTLAAPETVAKAATARPLRVAIVSPYDFAYPGGVTSHVANLDEQLRRLGHQVTIVAPSSKSPDELGRPNLVPLGRPVPIPTNGSIARITVSLTLGKKVSPLLERERFDVIHLHEPLVPALPLTFLRLARDAALVGTFHTYASRKRALGASRILLNKWAKRLHMRVAVSVPARDFVTRYFPGEYEIIPNGVDVDHFSKEAPPLPDFQDGKLNILFVGRMEKRKGLPHLLRAYAQAKWQFPDCRLMVVSPSPSLDRESARIIAERGLKDVHLLGYVPYAELPRYYRTADIFCSPATGEESQGIVLLEAMAAGRAIVASSIPGYKSVVTHGADGLLVNPRNELEFADTLLELLRNADLRGRLGAAAQEKAPRYRWETVASEILAVYRQAIAKRALLAK
jgi:phosphatidylinositol alpha-mannosyltransferase